MIVLCLFLSGLNVQLLALSVQPIKNAYSFPLHIYSIALVKRAVGLVVRLMRLFDPIKVVLSLAG